MKHIIFLVLLFVGNSAFSLEKISLNAGSSIKVQGVNDSVEVSCLGGAKPLPTCTIYCEQARTMAQQCDPYHVQIDGVTSYKSRDLEDVKNEIVKLKKLRVCR